MGKCELLGKKSLGFNPGKYRPSSVSDLGDT